MNTNDGLEMNETEATEELVIKNNFGLHARAAARLMEVAKPFDAEISLEKNGESVDVKDSVMSILTLECPIGSKVTVRAIGPDSQIAVEAIKELVENNFGE